MIANIHQSTASAFYNVRDKKVAQPSTYKQRVIADRLAMLIMLLVTIVFAVITA